MVHEIVIAGFGGQGVMSMGTLLAYAGMLQGKKVSWIPSYGPEMRGGTANCSVVVSDEEIVSPVVSEPTAGIMMNLPSLDKFETAIRTGGLLIVNSSMVNRRPARTDLKVLEIPANDIAFELGNDKVANMVVLGAFLEMTNAVRPDLVVESLKKALPPHRHSLIPVNQQALERGRDFVRAQAAGGAA
ncbi:MAG: 2-oxoacid:ferredoxin oxidoreductase subunit gamma [Firmicutes bacterium]|nr:2-oxoacid:ferredoxin oxidoreductase subunit gamma [Bacillota bacterium]